MKENGREAERTRRDGEREKGKSNIDGERKKRSVFNRICKLFTFI